MIHDFIISLVEGINTFGYLGIGILMAMESTVLPIPSELVLVPAGFLAHSGKMNIVLIIFVSTIGSWIGASFNYIVSQKVGRPFLEKYGKYFFVKEKMLKKTDEFFRKYGEISTFTGRLIPVMRHFISIPAGLTSMPFKIFSLYTLLGAFAWSSILTFLGFFIGDNQEIIQKYLPQITIGIITVAISIWGIYNIIQKKCGRK